MIQFKLADLEKYEQPGEGTFTLGWYWLTDGDLWMKLGDTTLYEYTEEAQAHFGLGKSAYNDYPISRFLEDFSELFERISESIPAELYNCTKDLNGFMQKAENWSDHNTPEEDDDFYFEEYDELTSWVSERELGSGHLIGGPHFWFFRHADQLRITWQTEHQLENGINLWTAKDGSHEMLYTEFIEMVKDFGERFFSQMGQQVELAVKKDWQHAALDKEGLLKEHHQRKAEFERQLLYLTDGPPESTDWQEILSLKQRMDQELG